jgi:hypothetical protein
MKRRQLLITLFGTAIADAIIAEALVKSEILADTSVGEPPISPFSDRSKDIADGITKTADQPLLRFAAIADTGVGSFDQYAVAQAMALVYQHSPFSMVLMAGDNIYPYGEMQYIESAFEKPYAPLLDQGVKFHAVLGNHDIINSNNGQDQINYPLFNMPARYYSFAKSFAKSLPPANDLDRNSELVEFFALDTNSNADWRSQLSWLDRQLVNSKALWKIVFGHHPLYSSGRHGGNQQLAAVLAPLFAKHRVGLYLCGHDHGYERFLPINGTTYIVNGGGGAPLYQFGSSGQTAFVSQRFSFMICDVYKDKIVTKAIAIDGNVFDRSIITHTL